MKVLVATEKPFAPAAVQGIREIIEGAGYELALLEKYTDKQQLFDAVADADGLIIRSDIVDNEVLDAAKNLKIVVRAGAGYDNVDLTSATTQRMCGEYSRSELQRRGRTGIRHDGNGSPQHVRRQERL